MTEMRYCHGKNWICRWIDVSIIPTFQDTWEGVSGLFDRGVKNKNPGPDGGGAVQQHGAGPNLLTIGPGPPLHQALLRSKSDTCLRLRQPIICRCFMALQKITLLQELQEA